MVIAVRCVYITHISPHILTYTSNHLTTYTNTYLLSISIRCGH